MREQGKRVGRPEVIQLADTDLDKVAGAEYRVVYVIAIRADGTNMQMWTTQVTTGAK
jgi:hypothetical protein